MTLGIFERMRVPWPAARIKTVGAATGGMLFTPPTPPRLPLPGDPSPPRPLTRVDSGMRGCACPFAGGHTPGASLGARRRTGGQGFEPRFSGPKPDVLPLDDPPRERPILARDPPGEPSG